MRTPFFICLFLSSSAYGITCSPPRDIAGVMKVRGIDPIEIECQDEKYQPTGERVALPGCLLKLETENWGTVFAIAGSERCRGLSVGSSDSFSLDGGCFGGLEPKACDGKVKNQKSKLGVVELATLARKADYVVLPSAIPKKPK